MQKVWKRMPQWLRDTVMFLFIMGCAVAVCELLSVCYDDNNPFATSVFILAVVLVSRFTTGYWPGILASAVGVVSVNYLFTYPFHEFNLTIDGYPLTFAVMLVVSVLVSTLTTQIKRQEQLRYEAERDRMRANLLRSVSHDIRTPLTAILSYSDYMSRKDGYTDAELREYFSLVRKKAAQMKDMTDRLLEGSKRNVEPVENGRLLMEQLAGEWEEILEDSFSCEISMENCTDFRAEWDMQEILRIFDNLSSNVEKYADSGHPVLLQMDRGVDTLRILQKNAVRQTAQKIESNQIGLESIRRITAGYGGAVTVSLDEKQFQIEITLPVAKKCKG